MALSQARAKATDPEMLKQYFDLLEQTITENSLKDKPCQIFNVDETGMPLMHTVERVYIRSASKILQSLRLEIRHK